MSRWRPANFNAICTDGSISKLEIRHLISTIYLTISQKGRLLNVVIHSQSLKKAMRQILDITRLETAVTGWIDLLKKMSQKIVQDDANDIRVRNGEPLVQQHKTLKCL